MISTHSTPLCPTSRDTQTYIPKGLTPNTKRIKMLDRLPSEILGAIANLICVSDLMAILGTGCPMLRTKILSPKCVQHLAVDSPDPRRASPTSLSIFQSVRSVAPYPPRASLKYPRTHENHPNTRPSYLRLESLPATVVTIHLCTSDPLFGFLQPLQRLADHHSNSYRLLASLSVASSEGAVDPWLPLEKICPTLQTLILVGLQDPIAHFSSGWADHWTETFLSHLPPTLTRFKSSVMRNYRLTSSKHYLSRLPRSLLFFDDSSRVNPIQDAMWGQLDFLSLPHTIQHINLSQAFPADLLSYFSALTHLKCAFITPKEPLLQNLPPTLQSLRMMRCDLANSPPKPIEIVPSLLPRALTRLIIPVGAVLSLSYLYGPRDPSDWPPGLRTLVLPDFSLPDLNQVFAMLPSSLAHLTTNSTVSNAPAFDKALEENIPRPALLQPSIRGQLVHLQLIYYSITITKPFLDQFPALQVLDMRASRIRESTLMNDLPPRLTRIQVSYVNLSGLSLFLIPKEKFLALTDAGMVDLQTLQYALHKALKRDYAPPVTFHASLFLSKLEAVPEGTTSVDPGLKWEVSDISRLPSTITELDGRFELDYSQIELLPKSITRLRDVILNVNSKSIQAALKRFLGYKIEPKEDFTENNKATQPSNASEENIEEDELISHSVRFPRTIIQNLVFPMEINPELRATIELTDECLSLLPSNLQILEFSDPAPLLSASCLKFIPRSLTTLEIRSSSLSSLIWPVVRELTNLQNLTIPPNVADGLSLDEVLSTLPPTLTGLCIRDGDDTRSVRQTEPVHISTSTLAKLPTSLRKLEFLMANTLTDACIAHLPPHLERLNLNSPQIKNPAWHEFPLSLRSVHISRLSNLTELSAYLERRRKSSTGTRTNTAKAPE